MNQGALAFIDGGRVIGVYVTDLVNLIAVVTAAGQAGAVFNARGQGEPTHGRRPA
ncbi:hypothetical protein [Streptomyces acidicola]|uniref:hypothetical protein n=1 Tax=Streptomyces acidicola TaxID=2596892 RepID=UPI00382C6651